jgi:glucose-6-phosphate dehydrogenase assembly protein OpcA
VSFIPGIPVPIGGIEKALGRLWEESGESKTRASLINLAIYSEEKNSLEKNYEVIQRIAGEHAMRSLLIHADPTAPGSSAEAWISMNCYLRGSKGGEVCSEQLSFQLCGEAARSLQSVVFSHLDSDLPLILWWQSAFRPPIDGKLWRWVDRLLFDSQTWNHPKEQFELVEQIAATTETRTVLCDLNWTRTFPLRQAVAGIFDSSCALPELQSLKSLKIDHAPRYHTTALLLVGWLADRLGWHLTMSGRNPQFQDARGGSVSVSLRESEELKECSIGRIVLESSSADFEVVREVASDLYIITVNGKGFPSATRTVRAPCDKINELLLLELSRGSQHALYSSAVKVVQSIWE